MQTFTRIKDNKGRIRFVDTKKAQNYIDTVGGERYDAPGVEIRDYDVEKYQTQGPLTTYTPTEQSKVVEKLQDRALQLPKAPLGPGGQQRMETAQSKSKQQRALEDQGMSTAEAGRQVYGERVNGRPQPATPIAPVPRKTTTTTSSITPVTSADIGSEIERLKRDQKLSNIQSAFDIAMGNIGLQEQEAQQAFQQQRTGVRTQDVMDRTRTGKMLSQQGLAGSGAATQSDIAQNVITQGAMSAIGQQEQNVMQQLRNKKAELEIKRAQGISDAQLAFDIAELQQLENAKAQEEQRFISTITRFSNDYMAEINRILNSGSQDEMWKIQYLEAARQQKIQSQNLDPLTGKPLGPTDQELQTFLATIDQFAGDYMAEINRIANDNDPSNDWKLQWLRARRQQKIQEQGLDPNTGLPIQQEPQIDWARVESLARWKVSNNIPLNEMEAQVIGVQPGFTQPTTSGGTSGGMTTAQQISLAKWKVDNGYELTDQEKQLLNISGPGDTTTVTTDTFRSNIQRQIENEQRVPVYGTDDLGNRIIKSYRNVPRTENEIKIIASRVIAEGVRDGTITRDQVIELAAEYSLSEDDLLRGARLVGGEEKENRTQP